MRSSSDHTRLEAGSASIMAEPVELAAASNTVKSHYDPTRTKKMYSRNSLALQSRVKDLWDR
jgi:hypothetical protein